MAYTDSGSNFLYADSSGEVTALNGKTIESIYGLTHDNKVCFFWLVVGNDTSAYRFFLELGCSCYFEKCSKSFFEEELEEYRSENELMEVSGLGNHEIASIKAYSEQSLKGIIFDIQTTEGAILRLANDDVGQEEKSRLYIKREFITDFERLL